MPGGIKQADALQRHMQARGVHHHEHGVQAASGLTDNPAHRFVKAHHAGRAAVQAHFFFNALAMHRAARTVGHEFGDQEQRQPLGAGRRIGQACQHQMHDVVAQVVFAARDENLGARDLVACVTLHNCFGARQTQVAAGVWFGQAHRRQPFAGGYFFKVKRFQRVAAMVLDAFISAMQQTGCHRPAVVGGTEHFIQHRFQHGGQSLAAVFRRCRQRRPASLPKGLISVAKAGRHGDFSGIPARTDFIAVPVQRRDHFVGKLAGLVQHLLHQRRVNVGEAGQGLQLRRGLQHLRQDEVHVIDRGLISVHDCY